MDMPMKDAAIAQGLGRQDRDARARLLLASAGIKVDGARPSDMRIRHPATLDRLLSLVIEQPELNSRDLLLAQASRLT